MYSDTGRKANGIWLGRFIREEVNCPPSCGAPCKGSAPIREAYREIGVLPVVPLLVNHIENSYSRGGTAHP